MKANDRDYNEKFQYAVSDHMLQCVAGGTSLRASRGIHSFVEPHDDENLSLLAHLKSMVPCALTHFSLLL